MLTKGGFKRRGKLLKTLARRTRKRKRELMRSESLLARAFSDFYASLQTRKLEQVTRFPGKNPLNIVLADMLYNTLTANGSIQELASTAFT